MKIIKAERFSSFYESFSDLIFGTMAIFILLMIVLLTQVKQENIEAIKNANEDMNKRLQESAKQLQKSAEKNAELQSAIEKMAQEIDAIKFKKLEILVAVDTTASMKDALVSLHETMSTLSAVLSKTSPDFKAAVVSYGQKPELLEFPLTRIFPERKDNGSSLHNLTQFFNNLVSMTDDRSGPAPVRMALTRAVAILNHKIASEDGLQIILLVGDVGPVEEVNNYMEELSETTKVVTTWLTSNPQRKILAVQTKPLSADPLILGYSTAFFTGLASLNNQNNSYTNNEGKILSMILDAIIEGK